MSDTQRQIKMEAEQALVNLLEHAKRLQNCSGPVVDPISPRITDDNNSESSLTVTNVTMKKPKFLPGNQRGSAVTMRKPRKMGLPSPPPPSPRDLCMIAELRDEYNQTDQLLDKMLTEATALSQDVMYCSQVQRDLTFVHDFVMDTTNRSINSLFEELGAETAECKDLQEILHRCCNALERSKDNIYTDPFTLDKNTPDTFVEGMPTIANIKAVDMSLNSNNPTVNMTDNMTVNMTDNMAVNMTDNMTVNMTNNMAVNMTNNMAVNMTNNMTVNPTSQLTSELTSKLTAELTAELTSDLTADLTAKLTADNDSVSPNKLDIMTLEGNLQGMTITEPTTK